MIDEDDLTRLIEDVYDAALDDQLWEPMLRKYADAAGSTGATLVVMDEVRPTNSYIMATGIDLSRAPEYFGHYVKIDPRVAYSRSRPVMEILSDYHHIDESEMRTDEFYEWNRRQGFKYYGAAILQRTNQRVCYVSTQRSPAEGPVGREEVDLLTHLRHHFQRALGVRERLADLEARSLCSFDAIDRFTFGVIFLDQHGQVLHANVVACRMAAKRDGLLLAQGGLRAQCKKDDRRLQQLIASALNKSPVSAGGSAGGTVAISRVGEPHAYGATVSRMHVPISPFASRVPAAVIFLSDPARPSPPTIDALRITFGLTCAESKLASYLASGGTLTDYAAEAGLSLHTVRGYAKRTYAKTGTSSQANLVGLILDTVPPIH